MVRFILVCLIFLGGLIYLAGVGWLLFFASPPEWLANTTLLLGAALATNFGAVLGIDLAKSPRGLKLSRRIGNFMKKISGFDKDKLPELAAGLYFVVLIVGSVAFLIKQPPKDLAHSLFYALLGAIVAAFAHILKK
jgi:hypothetical protein